MARPIKQGLDYFNLDVTADSDDKIQLIEGEHGIVGWGVVIKLLMKIYSNGYWYPWTAKESALMAKRCGIAVSQVDNVVKSAINWGFFDDKLYSEYKILTSQGIQNRFFFAAKDRTQVTVQREFLLVPLPEKLDFFNLPDLPELILEKPEVNPELMVVNPGINTHIILKDSIEKDSIEKHTGSINDPANPSNYPINDLKKTFAPRIRMCPDEYKALINLCVANTQDEKYLKEQIQIASDWTLSKGKSHKDAAAFMRNWLKRSFATIRRNGGGSSKWGTAGTVETVNQILKEEGVI